MTANPSSFRENTIPPNAKQWSKEDSRSLHSEHDVALGSDVNALSISFAFGIISTRYSKVIIFSLESRLCLLETLHLNKSNSASKITLPAVSLNTTLIIF